MLYFYKYTYLTHTHTRTQICRLNSQIAHAFGWAISEYKHFICSFIHSPSSWCTEAV